MAVQTVSINFLANATQANTAINQLQRNLNGLQRVAGGSGTAMGRLVGGFKGMIGPMVAVGAAYQGLAMSARLLAGAVKTNMDFEQTMQKVKSVMQESSKDVEKEFKALSETAREVGESTRFTAVQAAEGLEFLTKAGKSARESIDMLVPALHMAQAGNMELGDATQKLADMMSAFGAESSEAAYYADVLAMTAASSTTNMEQLSEAFKYVGAASGGMGQNFRETAVALGALANKGVKASMAGTAIRGTLVQLADSSSKAHRELLELGLTSGDIMPSKMNGLVSIMKKMKAAGVDAGNAYAIFGQRAGVAANVFTQFFDELVAMDDKMGDVDGAVSRMAATMDDSMTAATLKLKSAWTELMLTLGESGIMDALRGVTDSLTEKIRQLSVVLKVFKNAASAGELGSVLLNMFKYVAMEGANEIFNALVLSSKLFFNGLLGLILMLADPSMWAGIFGMLVGLLNGLSGIVSMFIAATIEAAAPLLMRIVEAIHRFDNGLQGAVIVAGGLLLKYVSMAASYLLESFRGIGEFLGMDVDAAIAKTKGLEQSGDDDIAQGQELMGLPDSFYKQEAENMVRGSYEGIRQEGEQTLATSEAQIGGAAFLMGESLNANFLDPLGKTLFDHEATDVFDTSRAEREIADAYARFRPKPTTLEDDPAKKSGEDENKSSGSGGAGFALAGSNRMATNLIMGRTINEVIAQVAAKQLSVQEDTLEEAKKQTTLLGAGVTTDYGTF
jgi:TP901 family phage tail tape measure protein